MYEITYQAIRQKIITNSLLPIANCLLPFAYCQLLFANCLLPTTNYNTIFLKRISLQ